MSLGLVLFIIFVLAANVIIGYVIATLLGIGPPNFRTAWALIKQSHPVARFRHVIRKAVPWLKGLRERLASFVSRSKKTDHQTAEESVSSVEETTEEKLQKISSKPVDDLLEDESMVITRISPIQELFDDNLMNIIFNQGTEAWMTNDKHIETSIHKLNLIMMESGQFAGELDEKLRSMKEDATIDEVRRTCKHLADDCRNYLVSQSKITDEIHARVEEFGELKELAHAIDHTNLEQVSQIESTLGNLDQLMLSEDVARTVKNMIREIANLRKARHNTRDIQDRAFVAIARSENRLGSVNREETFIDRTTGLNNRIAFQTHLWEWWEQERQKKTKLTFALYDVVGFTELNNHLGIRKCDKLLEALAKWIGEHLEGKDFIGMYAGNCLVSVSSGISLRKAIAAVEKIRQEIEYTEFVFGDGTEGVGLRLTCAVTEATDVQSEADLVGMLDQTLVAAKKAGRNVTFMYDPTKLTGAPEPVESPLLSVQDRIFDVNTMRFLDSAPV